MAKHYYLSRLGGADRRLLADEAAASETGERTRSAAMGGVLLTTASVATLSMFFALHHAIGVSVGWSVPLAIAWGVVIINIDRFLIITMSGTRGHPVQMAVTVLCRLALAALIAFIVATPLVLQIFSKDIGAELPILQQQQSRQFARSLANGAHGRQLAGINSEITAQQATVNNDQATVRKFAGQVQAARNRDATAFARWQCESGGLKGPQCPRGTSGLYGSGPLARSDHQAYLADVQNYNTINGELSAAEKAFSGAQQALGHLKTQQAAQKKKIDTLTAADDKANEKDTGLLEQVQALNTASAHNTGLAVAHWTVTALFFVIEILPVSIKCLLLLGPETPYESIVAKKGEAAVKQAETAISAEMDVAEKRAQSMRDVAELEMQAKRLEAETRRDIREAELQAMQDVETDLIHREKGTRIEANKRFASATRDHILAAVDDWARKIREKITQASQQQPRPNGQTQQTQVQQTPGYNTPSGGAI